MTDHKGQKIIWDLIARVEHRTGEPVALITFDMQEDFGEQAVGGGYARKVAGFRQGLLKGRLIGGRMSQSKLAYFARPKEEGR